MPGFGFDWQIGLTRHEGSPQDSREYQESPETVSPSLIIQIFAHHNSGGKLILLELTDTEDLIAGFVFGLLPGWWLGRLSENLYDCIDSVACRD